MLQIDHLGQHFTSQSIRFDSVFASDLSRARITAEGICRHQSSRNDGPPLTPTLTPDLRERDFGSLEGRRWTGPSFLAHAESESKVSMKRRATSFLNKYLLSLFFDNPDRDMNVAIVSHGLLLRTLWSCLGELFDPRHISSAPGIALWKGEPAALILPVWSNTGYMTLSIRQNPPQPHSTMQQHPEHRDTPLAQDLEMGITDSSMSALSQPVTDTSVLLRGWSMKVMAIDDQEHLSGLRRTRGGIGSATYDTRQKKIDDFFK